MDAEQTASGTVTAVLAANVRCRRELAGMTQAQLARAAGYRSGVSVCLIEAGARHTGIEWADRLARALGVSVRQLLEGFPGILCPQCGSAPPPGWRCLACGLGQPVPAARRAEAAVR